jgi:acyl-CoA thioesterase
LHSLKPRCLNVYLERKMMLNQIHIAPDGQLHAPMEPEYCAFKGAFGGWTAAHALVAAQSYAPQNLRPISLSIDFLGAIGPGAVVSAPTVVHTTRNVQFVSVQTTQQDLPKAKTSVILAQHQHTVQVDAVNMPDCVAAADLPALTFDSGPNTWVSRFEMRAAQGKMLQPNPQMRSLIWTRLKDTSPNYYASLVALADASFPRIYFHFTQVTPIATVTMSVHFHAQDTGLSDALHTFVLVEATANVAKHGFFDQHVRIWSTTGTLLATSTQLVRYNVEALA